MRRQYKSGGMRWQYKSSGMRIATIQEQYRKRQHRVAWTNGGSPARLPPCEFVLLRAPPRSFVLYRRRTIWCTVSGSELVTVRPLYGISLVSKCCVELISHSEESRGREREHWQTKFLVLHKAVCVWSGQVEWPACRGRIWLVMNFKILLAVRGLLLRLR